MSHITEVFQRGSEMIGSASLVGSVIQHEVWGAAYSGVWSVPRYWCLAASAAKVRCLSEMSESGRSSDLGSPSQSTTTFDNGVSSSTSSSMLTRAVTSSALQAQRSISHRKGQARGRADRPARCTFRIRAAATQRFCLVARVLFSSPRSNNYCPLSFAALLLTRSTIHWKSSLESISSASTFTNASGRAEAGRRLRISSLVSDIANISPTQNRQLGTERVECSTPAMSESAHALKLRRNHDPSHDIQNEQRHKRRNEPDEHDADANKCRIEASILRDSPRRPRRCICPPWSAAIAFGQGLAGTGVGSSGRT